MKNILMKSILIICIAAAVFCGWNIYASYQDMHQTKTDYENLTVNTNAYSVASPVNFEEMKNRNAEYCGWIWFDSQLISQPIVQTSDNTKYLHKDLDEQYSDYGTAFIDAANSQTDQNRTIYGHSYFEDINAATDSEYAFSLLNKLVDQQTYDQNKRFYIDWEAGVKTYQIFAVCSIDRSEVNWDYTQNVFQTDKDFYAFIHNAKAYSSISADVDVAATDHLITLQTCTTYGSLQRTVVIAKEIGS